MERLVQNIAVLLAVVLSACATVGERADFDKLQELAKTTSCDAPLILRVAEARPIGAEADTPVDTGIIDPETGEPFVLTRAQKWEAEARIKVAVLGYGDVMPIKADVQCSQADVMSYILPDASRLADTKGDDADTLDAEPSMEPATNLQVRYMTSAEVQADASVRCVTIYQQIYQPPLTLGGSGRVIQIANGERCRRAFNNDIEISIGGEFKRFLILNVSGQTGLGL